MAISIGDSLLGDLPLDDGTCIKGAVPAYNASGGLPMLVPPLPSTRFGGVVTRVPLFSAKNDDGTTPTGTTAAGNWHYVNTAGTSLLLLSEAANNGTKTDKVDFEVVIPQFYVAASNITVTINALHTLNGGTASVKSIQAKVYLLADAGTSSADLGPGTASTLTTSAADYTFAVTGTTLTPGARILIQITGIVTETASGGGVTETINSVRIS